MIIGMTPWTCVAADVVSSVVNPVWANLPLILEKGGMPAVILLFGWLYLRSVNNKWATAIENMQAQFVQQQNLLLVVVQNNTAMLSTLSTKLGVGCLLFQRTGEQMTADREVERRAVEFKADVKKAVGGFEVGANDGKKD
jgi:hypothetical protein